MIGFTLLSTLLERNFYYIANLYELIPEQSNILYTSLQGTGIMIKANDTVATGPAPQAKSWERIYWL